MLYRNTLVRWVLVGQVVLTVILAVIAGVFGGFTVAGSLVLGGMIGLLGNLVYVWRAMRPESNPANALKGQVVAEFYKFVVAVSLFVLIFTTINDVSIVMVFVGFGTTFIVHWFAMLRRNQWIGETGRS